MSEKQNPNGRSPPPPSHRRHQPDAKWAAMDAYALSHLHPDTTPNAKALSAALTHSTTSGLPDISSSRAFGKFLALQAKALSARHALEIGTLGGYTAIWLATENPGLEITTLEYDGRHAEVARENIARAGVAGQITVIVGSALDTLPLIVDDVLAGKRRPFDITFVDADKENNYRYFDLAVKGSRKGAVVVVDNVVQGGDVAASDEESVARHVGARTVIEKAGRDGRVGCVVLQTVGERSYDGFLFAVVL